MLLSVPVSKAAKLLIATEHRCRLPGNTVHKPLYSAVPPCLPDACSVSSPLSQKGRVVAVEPASSDPPPSDVVARDSTAVAADFALYAGRFSSQTLPSPLTIASQNSGAPVVSWKRARAR